MDVDAQLLAELLDVWPVARLATVTASGNPHVIPVVFVAHEGCVYSPVDGKRKGARTLARLVNVMAHGTASLLLDDYTAEWQTLWWVRLDGPARVVTGDVSLIGQVGERMRGKYPQYRTVAPFSGTPTLLALPWRRVSAWAQSGEVGTIRTALKRQVRETTRQ